MSEEGNNTRSPRLVFSTALFLTAVVSALFVWMMSSETCSFEFRFAENCETRWRYFWFAPPNEIGDTLAGFAGTLALVWIVASVVVQRMELSSTVRQLSKTARIEEEREALRQYDMLMEELLEAFYSAEPSDLMYGEWAYRPVYQGNMEHLYVRSTRNSQTLRAEQDIPRIYDVIALNVPRIIANKTKLTTKPVMTKQHRDLLLLLGHLSLLEPKLPSLERRKLREWRISAAREQLQKIFVDQDLWKQIEK